MTRLTKEEVKAFIEKRYPKEKIAEIVMINDEETMAFVLTYTNTSCVTRYTIDIDSSGEINTWEIEMSRFNQIWRRNEL
ncbi:MAG: hypothetical protein IIY23_04345 [Erysipelotrichaceae bacterium]|nr:hypothetical protein [Erysipelotrichaceae bacterium]